MKLKVLVWPPYVKCPHRNCSRSLNKVEMSRKRINSSSPSAPAVSSNKRLRSSSFEYSDDAYDIPNEASQFRVDPTYGQRGAFPGLDNEDHGNLFYGPANDGFEYLRMVRSGPSLLRVDIS